MDAKPVPATKVHVPEEDIPALTSAIGEILRSGQLTLGKHTVQFESEYGSYLGVRHAVAVNSGTSALEIILRGLHLVGEDVVVPTNTFAATAFAVHHSGNRVVLADVGEELCLSLAALEASVTRRTRAIVLVHIGGLVARDTARIVEFCRDRDIVLLEDAAHAHGSTFEGRYAGTFGLAASFSFYPTKVMTSGEGGMVVTEDASLADTARILRDQGKAGFTTNLHVEMGYNWRLSEIHAAIGVAQLRRLASFIERRRHVAGAYDRELRDVTCLRPLVPSSGVHSNYYKYIAFLADGIDRAELKSRLRKQSMVSLAGEVYDVPLHRQPVFEKAGIGSGRTFEVADDLCGRHVCLPMSAVMDDSDVHRVAEALRQV